MRRNAVLTAAMVALAACGSEAPREPEAEVEARNATVEEVAEQVREAGDGASFIRAGKWVSTVTFEEMTAPGMPAEAAEQIRKMMGEGKRYESCLAEDQVQRPNEDFFAGQNNQCRYDHFTMGDGKIDARMRCTQGEVDRVMEMKGSYSPTSYEIRMTTSLDGAATPASDLRMRMRVDAQRVGECDRTTG